MRTILFFSIIILCLIPPYYALAEKEKNPIPDPRTLLKDASALIAGEEKRNHTLISIAELQTQLGELDDAIKTISLMGRDYPYDTDAIEKVVDLLVADGMFDQAIQVLGSSDEEFFKDQTLQEIAVAKAETGDLPGALKMISNLTWKADKAYQEIALLLAHEGDVDQAFQMIGKIQNKEFMETATVYIGAIQAQAGDISGALKTGATLRPEVRAHSRWPIVCKLADEGNLVEAWRNVPPESDDPSDSWARDLALRCIPPAQAEQGDLKGALQTISNISGPAYKREALLEIIQARVMQGDFSGAEEAIALMDDEDKDFGFFIISAEYSQRRQFNKARQIALGISNTSLRDTTFEMVIRDQAQDRQFRSALRDVDTIQGGCYKDRALSAIAIALARSGQNSSAREIINERITGGCLDRISYDYFTISTRSNGKRMLSSTLRFPDSKLITIREIAKGQTKEGEVMGALQWADDLVFPLERASALIGIAEGIIAQTS